MQKPYRSVLKRVILWPLFIMFFLSAAVFVTAMLNYDQARKQETENHLSVMRSGYTQLQNIMRQCEFTFARYFSTEPSSGILKNVEEGAQITEYLEAMVDSIRILEPLKNANEIVDGIFLYFPNIPSLNFRGISQKDLQDAISEKLVQEDAIYNQWHLISTGSGRYMVYIMRSQKACCGCWMRADYVISRLGLENDNVRGGEFYIADHFENNTLSEEGLHDTVAAEEIGIKSVKSGRKKYDNYVIPDSGKIEAVYLGLLIPEGNLFGQMPLLHRIVFLMAFLGFASTIIVVLWLNSRISKPIFQLKEAMERFGNGEVEYRLEERNARTADEFDLLGHSLNEMMDQVNELEYNLYETRLKEQEINLKYISQQIRPHFILNALNVIYTYKEDEFPLIKKMVIYLVNYFRYIVNLRVDFVELRYEFRHIENYLKIQRERTQNKIDFFVEWEHSVSDVLIPPLILQTFVENSIKYAVNDNTLFIILRGYEEDGKLKIRISDTGQGFDEKTLQNIRTFLETREEDGSLGVGIVNTVQRMDILYHGKVDLTVSNTESGGACTEITLPLLRKEAAPQEEKERTRKDVQCSDC